MNKEEIIQSVKKSLIKSGFGYCGVDFEISDFEDIFAFRTKSGEKFSLQLNLLDEKDTKNNVVEK